MRKYLIATVLVAVSIMAGGVYCEEEIDEAALSALEGRVTMVDLAGSKLTVNSGVGIDTTFPITGETELITSDGTGTEFSKISAGDYVNVEYFQGDDGVIKTLRVEVDFTKKDANKEWDDAALYKGKEW